MLPKNRRIERKFFNQIIKHGKRYNSPSFLLYVAEISPEKSESPSKFSFSASKKVVKRATDRNRLRRRGYSIISRNIKGLKNGNLYFFTYKKSFEKDFSKLEKEIIQLLSPFVVLI